MAKQSRPPEPRPAEITVETKKQAIPKLRRRIEELKAFDVSSVKERYDPRLKALEDKIDDVLVGIFGNDTVEYNRYRVYRLDEAPTSSMYETPINQVHDGIKNGIATAITNLETIISLFQEQIEDLGESPTGRATRAFSSMDIHPNILIASGNLFKDGHYSNAVEDACKALDALVKMRSGNYDLSGTSLMQTVFSSNSPVLKFNNLVTDTEKSEQQGMMFLYSGAMLALRNPRAHEIIKDDPEIAIEFIGFISLLAKSLDRTTKS